MQYATVIVCVCVCMCVLQCAHTRILRQFIADENEMSAHRPDCFIRLALIRSKIIRIITLFYFFLYFFFYLLFVSYLTLYNAQIMVDNC